MRKFKLVILYLCCIIAVCACGCGKNKKTILTREQLENKEFEIDSRINESELQGKWVHETGRECYDIRKEVIAVFSLTDSGSYQFSRVLGFQIDYIGEDGLKLWRYEAEVIEKEGKSSVVLFYDIVSDMGDDLWGMDTSRQFIQLLSVQGYHNGKAIWKGESWGERFYKDDSIDLPVVTQNDIDAWLKKAKDAYKKSMEENY